MALQPPTGFERASLQIEGEPQKLDCWFNPKEYTIQKQNTWNFRPIVGAALPRPQFGGGQPRKLTLELLFDATDTSSADHDVKAVTDRLFKMMEVDRSLPGTGRTRNSARPPTVTFSWGRVVSFKAVANSLSVQYLLFSANGAPIRAQAHLDLTQVEPTVDRSSGRGGGGRTTNPTTRATPDLGSHLVRDGDSLASIAYLHYRDPSRWRAIAEANGIDDPLGLRRGSTLTIPRIEG